MVRNSGFFIYIFFQKCFLNGNHIQQALFWGCFKLKSCCWNCCSGPSNRLRKTSLAQPKQLTIPLNTLPSIWILVNSYHFFYLLFLGFKNLTIFDRPYCISTCVRLAFGLISQEFPLRRLTTWPKKSDIVGRSLFCSWLDGWLTGLAVK